MSGTVCCIFLTSWTTPHFPAATFRIAALSFAQESNLKCRKDLFKALRLVHQRRKQKHVVSSRDTAYLWDKFFEYEILSSVDLGRKKYKLWMLFCSACLGKPRVLHRKCWRSLRNASLGKPRVHAKSRSTCERPTRTRWKRLGNIDGLREDAHFVMDAIYGFIDAGGIAHGPELRKECRNIQEFWIWKHHRVCSVLREWWSKEIQKLRMYFPQRLRAHCGKNPYCLRICKSKRSLGLCVMLGENARSRRCK